MVQDENLGPVLASDNVVACVSVCLSVHLLVHLFLCQSLDYLCGNFGPVQPAITKFGSEVQNNLVKISIVLRVERP